VSPTGKLPAAEALDRDAAALIALWLQIYGGDPPPGQVEVSPATSMLAAAMVTQLSTEYRASVAPLTNAQLAARLSRLGLELGQTDEDTKSEIASFPRLTCVKGPDGEPGCCVGSPVHIAVNE